MLNRFFTSLLVTITKFLGANKDFFGLSETEKSKLLQDLKLPSNIKHYLSSTTFEVLAQDILNIIKHIQDNKVSLKNNGLASETAKFLAENFANDVYSLPLDFFKLHYNEQLEVAGNLINSTSDLAMSLKDILVNYSYQEIIAGIQALLSECLGSPIIIVQSPCEIDTETKKEIQTKLNEDNQALCLPFFQVNKKIIGGLRIFVNGKVSDFSWLGKINLITSLK